MLTVNHNAGAARARRVHSALPVAAVFLAIATISGCEPSRVEVGANRQDFLLPTTPEEKFASIVETFRRWIDDPSPGRVSGFAAVSAGGGRSRFQYQTEIRSELQEPAEAGETFRGTITVITKASYLFRPSAEDPAKPAEQDTSDGESNTVLGGLETPELDDPDAALSGLNVQGTADTPSLLPAATLEAQDFPPDRRVYELAYEDDRWVLKTELDSETEQSVIGAFKRALGTEDVPIKPIFNAEQQ